MAEFTPEDKIVLSAFDKSSFTIRTPAGLSKDAGLPKADVQTAINRLMAHGLVDQIVREDGVRFYLTREGRVATTDLSPSKAAS